MDLRYVKILRLAMKTIGSWPSRELGEKVWRNSDYYLLYLFVQALCAFIPAILYVVYEAKNIPFLIIGHSFITLLICFTSTAKILLLSIRRRFKEFGKLFFQKMHLFYMKDKSDYAMKTYIQVHKLSELCTFYLMAMLCATIIFFNVGPIYVNFYEGLYSRGIPDNSTKVYAIAVYFRYPFDPNYVYLKNFRPYLIVTVFNWIISYFCGTFLTVLDLYIYVIVFHIWGHFKILTHDLKCVPKPIADATKTIEENVLGKYSAEESKYVNKKLKECIDYHRVIKDFTKNMSDVFGPTLLVYTGFMLIVSCLLLLECSYMNMEASMRYGPLTLMVFQELIQFGLVFELIGTAELIQFGLVFKLIGTATSLYTPLAGQSILIKGENLETVIYDLPWECMDTNNRKIVLVALMNTIGENLKTVVYDLPWECMDCTNRKIVLVLLMNVQKPMRVKALGVTDMGIATIAKIIKTSFSYFTVLRTID